MAINIFNLLGIIIGAILILINFEPKKLKFNDLDSLSRLLGVALGIILFYLGLRGLAL